MASRSRRTWVGCLIAAFAWAPGCFVAFEDYAVAERDAGQGLDASTAGTGAIGNGGAGGTAGTGGSDGAAASAGSAGLGSDAATVDAGPDAGECLVKVSDDFEDGVLDSSDPNWYAFDLGVTPSESSGSLRLDWPLEADPGMAGGVSSLALFDFRNCSATVQVLEVPALGSGAFLRFAVQPSQGSSFDFVLQDDGMLHAVAVNKGGETSTPVTYEPIEHAWWRLRELAGIFHWEVSPDGSKWQTIRSAPSGSIAIDAAHLIVGGGTASEINVSGIAARFDNVNRPP